MSNLTFRNLRADEIECRVKVVKDSGCSLLLYKDARCDMNILDETVGALNWQRKHTRENANCIVSVWDEEKQQWISKEDTGTESNTEKEKGLASDSFKRACTNFGIGRELYTAPFIWINSKDYEKQKNGNPKDSFSVSKVNIECGKITALEITNDSTGKVVYKMGGKANTQKPAEAPKQPDTAKKTEKAREYSYNDVEALKSELSALVVDDAAEELLKKIMEHFKVDGISMMNGTQLEKAIERLKKGNK